MKAQNILQSVIGQLEVYGNQHELNHRFVGGVSFGGLLNEKTTYDINFDDKTVLLHKHNTESLLRQDKTIRDIDLIFFCPDKRKITEFSIFIEKLRKEHKAAGAGLQPASKQYIPFPDISFEPTIYPSFGKRNAFAQFVTALEVDEKNHLFLAFDSITQQISWQSVEAWKVVLEDGLAFTVRNPIADYYAYIFRSPGGPKPKDVKKLQYVKKLADTLIELGQKQDPKINYLSDQYYGTWIKYIEQLEKTTDPVINAKKMWLSFYWQTVGDTLAHNFARYANNFTGVRQ